MAKDQSSSDENLGEAKTMQIGDDGKPIGADAVQNKDSQDSDNLGKAKPMTIGDDGKPVPTNSN